MDFRAPAVGGFPPLVASARSSRAGGTPAPARPESLPAVTVSLSVGPPESVLAEVAAAAERAEDLRRQNRELRFELDQETGRVRVEVRDLDGRLIRAIPLREALDIAAGAPLE